MTTCAIQAKETAPVARVSLQSQGGAGVGITPKARKQHHQAEQEHRNARHQGEEGEQTTALGRLLTRGRHWGRGSG